MEIHGRWLYARTYPRERKLGDSVIPLQSDLPGTGKAQVVLRLPDELLGKLEVDTVKFDCTVQSMLLWIADRYYGVESREPKRGRPVK